MLSPVLSLCNTFHNILCREIQIFLTGEYKNEIRYRCDRSVIEDNSKKFELSLNGNSYEKKLAGLIQKEIRDAILKSGSPDAYNKWRYSGC
jgi:hypothetical protein